MKKQKAQTEAIKSHCRKETGNAWRNLVRKLFVAFFVLVLLTGCSARELEARDFVSVLTIPEGNPEKLLGERQKKSIQTLDYSHAKAVIISEAVTLEAGQWQQVLETLTSNPEFAWNLLIFTGEEEVLQKAEEEKETAGISLAAYYKNQKALAEKTAAPVTLMDLWNWRMNEGGELKIPRLVFKEGNLFPEGTLSIS